MPKLVDLLDKEDEREEKQEEQLIVRAIDQTPENHVAFIIDTFTRFEDMHIPESSGLRKAIWRHCFFHPREFYDPVHYRKKDVPYILAMIIEKLVGRYESIVDIAQKSFKDALIKTDDLFTSCPGTVLFNREKETIERQTKKEEYSYLPRRHPFAYLASQAYLLRLDETNRRSALNAVSIVELLELLVMQEYLRKEKDLPNHDRLNSIFLYDQSRISTRFGKFLRSINEK